MDYQALNDALLKGSKKTLFYVAVVPVNSQGQVLVAERKIDGIWTTPCGGAEMNETPEQAAIRECWEEAGLAIIPSMLEPMGVKVAPNGKPVHCFLVRTNQENFSVKLDPDREVSEWKWYSRENLPDGLSRQKNANRLETISQALMKFYGLSKSDKSRAHWVTVGTKVEMEHTSDREKAKKIALDHLAEDPDYYKDWDNKEKILFQEKAPKIEKSDIESLVDKLSKGGEGSGVVGHTTAKKPGDAPQINKVQAHLDLLRNGGALPGVHTKSGKPVVTDMDAARAQGYTLDDHVDAMNVHYQMAQKVNGMIEKMKMAGKQAPKEAVQIAKFHEKQMRNHMGARDTMERRMKSVKKSVTQMGSGLGDRDIDIGSFAQAHDKASAEWLEKLHSGMADFNFGDNPRSFQTDKGMIHLCKVDDGLYSGHFTNQEIVGDGMLEDNAKVRIERMTIPELVQFMTAKEWIRDQSVAQTESPVQAPIMTSEQVGLAYAAEMDRVSDEIALQEKLSRPSSTISMRQFEDNEQKIRMLELISKLIG